MAAGGPSQAKSSACSEIRIANSLSEIERVAALVDSFGACHRLSNEVNVALNVSLDEILNNIISYGYEDAGHHDIMVRLELRGASIDVVVEDDGKPFDPLLVPAPDLGAMLFPDVALSSMACTTANNKAMFADELAHASESRASRRH